MRWVAIALVLLSLPLFVSMLQAGQLKRNTALVLIGFMLFVAGRIHIDPALITWPLWNGSVRGIQISPLDCLALALLMTRGRWIDRLPFLGIIGLYAVPVVCSLVFASVPMATVFTIVLLAQSTLVFVAVAGELARPNALRSLVLGMGLGMMLQAGFVIQEKLARVVQATGTMEHQNILGVMIEFAILPLYASVLEGEKRKLAALGVLAGLIVIAGGGSRATMGLTAASMAVLTLLSIVRRPTAYKSRIAGLGILAALLVVPLGMATLKDRFGDTSILSEEQQRKAFERAAIAMAADHPFGVGANLYVNVANMQGYDERAGVAWNPANRAAPVHNAYLLARAETGWAGQLTFMIMLLVPVVVGCGLAFRRRGSPEDGIVLGASIAIACVALHSNYEFAWHDAQPKLLFFINMAIIAGRVRHARLDHLKRKRAAPEALVASPLHGALPA